MCFLLSFALPCILQFLNICLSTGCDSHFPVFVYHKKGCNSVEFNSLLFRVILTLGYNTTEEENIYQCSSFCTLYIGGYGLDNANILYEKKRLLLCWLLFRLSLIYFHVSVVTLLCEVCFVKP